MSPLPTLQQAPRKVKGHAQLCELRRFEGLASQELNKWKTVSSKIFRICI